MPKMRNPNGYGSVFKLKGNRRRPFVARITKFNWRYWKPLMQKLDMAHLPHDGRPTYATRLDNAGANKTIVKKILGHAGQGMTEKVYTHKTVKQLVDAINLI